ncbi:MAG: hypothetical protein Q8M06_04980 [Methanobacteriaceae archaeon]|nr:hypothetical protein [Methanobacteriaceae archaeon]
MPKGLDLAREKHFRLADYRHLTCRRALHSPEWEPTCSLSFLPHQH